MTWSALRTDTVRSEVCTCDCAVGTTAVLGRQSFYDAISMGFLFVRSPCPQVDGGALAPSTQRTMPWVKKEELATSRRIVPMQGAKIRASAFEQSFSLMDAFDSQRR